MNRLNKFFIFFLTICVFASCRNDVPKTQNNLPTREITDDLGKKIELPTKVTRAISLAPNLTEIIFAVDAGDALVGVTTICNYPEKAKEIQKIGDSLKPNIENIIALKPQVVFVSTASQLESFTQTLEKQRIKVFVTNPNSLESIYKSIEKVGEVLGKKEKADEVVEGLKKRVSLVEKKTEDVKKTKVFVQLDESPFTIGKGSFITDLIEKAGGVSVTADVDKPYFKISKERILALNPDVIILSDSPDNKEPVEVFKNSEAVKNKRVYRINSDIMSRPGPRIIEALEEISKKLHPEKFE